MAAQEVPVASKPHTLRLNTGVFWQMALRASLLQATWNYERQQGLGWAWALEPALRRLYPDATERRERLAQHTAYFNTQPTLASLALGAVAALEERRAGGEGLNDEGIRRVKNVLGSSLAATGDRLFWFTLHPFAACLGILLATTGTWIGAAAFWVCYNLVHQGIRVLGVGWGYRAGPGVLSARVRNRFNSMIRLLSAGGAMLVGVLAAGFLVPGGQPAPIVFQALLAAGLTLGLIGAQRSRPSPTEWGLGLCGLCLIAVWYRG
jgi:PTS system mannose-specific IID component